MNIRTLSACVLITLLSTPLFGQTLYGLKKTVNGSMTVIVKLIQLKYLIPIFLILKKQSKVLAGWKS